VSIVEASRTFQSWRDTFLSLIFSVTNKSIRDNALSETEI